MNYDKIRTKTQKFHKGGKIPKYWGGGEMPTMDEMLAAGYTLELALKVMGQFQQSDLHYAAVLEEKYKSLLVGGLETLEGLGASDDDLATVDSVLDSLNPDKGSIFDRAVAGMLNAPAAPILPEEEPESISDKEFAQEESKARAKLLEQLEEDDKEARWKAFKAGANNFAKQMGFEGGIGQMGASVGTKALNMADEALMGDKNFGSQSQAIDSAVHGVSGALIKSGNPYAAIAGVALEGANFLTKAGGLTVLGFDVDINSSGYGQMGHMESKSSRDWGAMIGLGGLNRGRMLRQLEKRNQQAMMAMTAADIANDLKFEQEARMNSVLNTIMNNQIALAGGIGLESLGA